MKKMTKKIKPEINDQLIIAKLSKNKARYDEIVNEYKDHMYEEIEIEIPEEDIISSSEEIEYVNELVDKGLEEYEEYIYSGVERGSMFQFDFRDKSVSISYNIMNNYLFLVEDKRVWFSSNLYKSSYVYANYETGEILNYLGPENVKERFLKEFNFKEAIDEILYCSQASSLEDLFRYYIKEDL